MFNNFLKTTRDYFSLTNREVKGFVVVFLLTLFFTFTPLLLPFFRSRISQEVSKQDKQLLDSLVSVLNNAYRKPKVKIEIPIVDKKQSAIVVKLPQQKNSLALISSTRKLDLNKISLVNLKSLKVVGSKYAERIIKFRDKLGGFYDINQLKEVYGLSDLYYNKLLAKLFVKENYEVKKINVNKATFKDLLAHPYLDYEEVKSIFVTFRNKNKFIENILKIEQETIISHDKATKLKNYLSY